MSRKNALLEYLEDMSDSKAIADAKKKGGKMITHAQLKAQLGLCGFQPSDAPEKTVERRKGGQHEPNL